MLSSERPKTLREPGTNKRRAGALKDVKVGALNDGIIEELQLWISREQFQFSHKQAQAQGRYQSRIG